jgi:hypothetical protein
MGLPEAVCSGQERMRYGSAPSGVFAASLLMISGSRRGAVRAHQHDALVGHDQRRGHAFQVLGRLLQDVLELIRAIAARGARADGIGEQQLEVLVQRSDRLRQMLDGGARDEVAAQAFQSRAEQRMHEREAAGLGGFRAIRATDDGENRDEHVLVVAHPAHVDRLAALEQTQLARAFNIFASGGDTGSDERAEIGPSRGFTRPSHLAVRVEHANCGRAWKQRADELCVRFERAPGVRSSGALPRWNHSLVTVLP